MNVKLAAQTLSHSVAAGRLKMYNIKSCEHSLIVIICLALSEYHRLGLMPSEVLQTAKVVEEVNTMFDLMNSCSTNFSGPKSVIHRNFLHMKMQVSFS
jgi:hypothetical protein